MSLTSGSELCVLLFRVSASAYFREIPCHSVANSSACSSFRVSASAYFREIPCHSVANSSAFASAFACSYFREIPCHSVASLLLLLCVVSVFVCG